MLRVPMDEFQVLVEKALDGLPSQFAEMLDNVAVVVEDEPDPEILREMGFDDEEELLGLYQGVPQPVRETGMMELPDKVSIYRGPLLRICDSRRELIREVRDTVVHELGHHFGLSDEEMPF
ncbi:MAG: metallopeptidase family protein [Acidobacteriota bacterium]